ncbi:hypothetical protein RB597_000888 [Gaeumannomyces tritici]
MDFWSRLLAHTPLSSDSSRRDHAKDPFRRLQRFEKKYGQMLQIWRSTSNLARDEDAAEAIEERLVELTAILADESRRPLPHPCIAFSASKQIYVPVSKIATTSYDECIVREAVLFFATLIESEEEAFVESEAFANSLITLLLRITGANSFQLGSDTEIRIVELAFNITTKIRLDPASVLAAWFKSSPPPPPPPPPQQQQQTVSSDAGPEKQLQDSHDKFAGRTQKQDFPLFYLLVDYIHHEGKVGDFARTGLLYVIEAASSSVDLERWIVESDLSTLMATGLGALYSQLSRKLVIDHPADQLPPILALSDYQHPKSTYEIVSSCSPEFQAHLDTFLSHLLFWQDVLNHCKSVEVKSTLLEHFRIIFLKQLLYPSLLESSDMDGGSSVAVLTYLRRILESLDHPDMISLILSYLLALPEAAALETSSAEGPRNTVSAARKRKSMDLLSMIAAQSETAADPLLYNLVDLILSCLRSHSHQTIHVTLQLVSAILRRHHRYATATLLKTEGVHSAARRRTIGAHSQEVDFFMSLAGAIGGQDDFDALYEDSLRDATTRLESHPCSLKLVAPRTSTDNHDLPAVPIDSLPGAPRDVHRHTVRPDDPLLNAVLDLLETFFVNPIETNLSVTETLFDLAVCGFVSMEGWMLRHPDKYTFGDDNDDDDDDDYDDSQQPLSPAALDPDSPEFAELRRAREMRKCRRRPRWSPIGLTRLLALLQTLSEQVEAYRESVPRFDDLLQQRREAFQTANASGASVNPQPGARSSSGGRAGAAITPIMGTGEWRHRSSVSDSRSSSPGGIPAALEGFAQRILSELGTPSRTGSPRGRKDSAGDRLRPGGGRSSTSTPSLSQGEFAGGQWSASSTAMTGGYGLATPTATSTIPPPRYDNPTASSSPSRGPAGSPMRSGGDRGRDPAVASQVEAFKAIDQQILARRVCLPAVTRIVQPIPLDLSGKKLATGTKEPGTGDLDGARDGDVTDEKTQVSQQPMSLEMELAAEENGDGNEDEQHEEAATDAPAKEPEEPKTVSVSHLLTNVLVLQSFLFELASLAQARAALFDEVRFA